MDQRVSGSCLCGAVKFSIRLPTLWCAHCHCSQCQRAHGSAFVTWVGVPGPAFELGDGVPLVWFNSSAGAQRGFCRDCGSSLLFRSDRWPGEVHVTLANLHAAIDRSPQLHVFHDSHVDWVQLGDELPRRAALAT